MRKKLFDIIEKAEGNNRASHIYDVFMICVIVISMIPLAIKNAPIFFVYLEWVVTGIFIVDYILRLITADIKLGKGKKSFLLYPFTPMAIIDILSILPTILLINEALRVLKTFRLIRALRVFKIFKGFRYSKQMEIIASVFKRQKKSLVAVGGLAIGYIFLSALVVFNVEPETFGSFFDALYWATVSLTTVGYGDIYTVSMIGKSITMVSAILGVAIVALPAGIITAGYMGELQKGDNEEKENTDEKDT
jgi:voltage-gated potassium channel